MWSFSPSFSPAYSSSFVFDLAFRLYLSDRFPTYAFVVINDFAELPGCYAAAVPGIIAGYWITQVVVESTWFTLLHLIQHHLSLFLLSSLDLRHPIPPFFACIFLVIDSFAAWIVFPELFRVWGRAYNVIPMLFLLYSLRWSLIFCGVRVTLCYIPALVVYLLLLSSRKTHTIRS